MRDVAVTAGRALVALWVAVTMTFALPRLAPGGPLDYLLGQDIAIATPMQKASLLAQFGLDRPVPEQYVRYLAGIATGDLGTSVRQGVPVTRVLARRLPLTLALAIPAIVLSVVAGTVLGVVAAVRRAGRVDAGLLGVLLGLESMPAFWLGMVLIAVFAAGLGWLPSFGVASPGGVGEGGGGGVAGFDSAAAVDAMRHLVLPVATLTLVSIGPTFLIVRGAMLATLAEDHLAYAVARGLPRRWILLGHALRNALLPMWTHLALVVGAAFGGAVVVETVFSYPGIGRQIYDAVLARDYPVLEGAFLVLATAVIGCNLVADLTYPLLDPRVRRPVRVRGLS